MSSPDYEFLVHRYVEEVLNGGKFEVLDDLVSPHYKRYLSPTAAPLTPEAQKQRLAGLHAAFPDIHLTVEDLIVQGDKVAVRMTLRGTHRGIFQGIAPTGKQVTVSAFDIIHFENERLNEHWGGPDLFSLVQQLGAALPLHPHNET